MCDVYVYESDDGLEVHVASHRRPEGSVPTVTASLFTDPGEFARQHDVQMAALKGVPLYVIGLSRDGQSYTVQSPGECADLLEDLSSEGYKVPDDVIAELRSESVTQ